MFQTLRDIFDAAAVNRTGRRTLLLGISEIFSNFYRPNVQMGNIPDVLKLYCPVVDREMYGRNVITIFISNVHRNQSRKMLKVNYSDDSNIIGECLFTCGCIVYF